MNTIPFARIESVQDIPQTGKLPWRAVVGNMTAAVLDADGHTLFLTRGTGIAQQIVTAVNEYSAHVASIATTETALKRIRDRVRRASKDQVTSDVLALVDFGLADDGEEPGDFWAEEK